MISINGKDMNEEYGCIAQFKKKLNRNYVFSLKTFSNYMDAIEKPNKTIYI